jgi:hypothetical protein
VFENRVLRRIFGSKRNEVMGEWGKLHKEELNDLYCSPNILRVIKSRRIRWAGHLARMEERRGVYKVLVEKPEGVIDWIDLAQDRNRRWALVNAVMNVWVT